MGTECDNRSNNVLIRTDDGDATNDDVLAEDFAYRVPNTLYGNVWEDNNGDGSWEDGENGFSNVTVYLDNCGPDGTCGTADDTTTSTTTAADGSYLFSDLADGTYRVRVDTSDPDFPAGLTAVYDPDTTLDGQTVAVISGGVEDYQWPISPTAVRLVSFTATAVDGQVLVAWETASEIDNLGFNLYRSDSHYGSRTQLNESLIPSQAPGSSMGATYSWEDVDIEVGDMYFYWLEDIDIYGTRTLHGPVDVRVLYYGFLPIVSR